MKKENTLKYCKVRKVKSPERGTPVAGGLDFFVPEDLDINTFKSKCDITGCYVEYVANNNIIEKLILKPGESVMIPSGIKMKIMDGWALVFMNKSGQAVKKQLDVLACLVDQDYENEVHISLVNTGLKTQYINAGEKIVQGVLVPMNYAIPEEVENEEILFANSDSVRKGGGFGSTGSY